MRSAAGVVYSSRFDVFGRFCWVVKGAVLGHKQRATKVTLQPVFVAAVWLFLRKIFLAGGESVRRLSARFCSFLSFFVRRYLPSVLALFLHLLVACCCALFVASPFFLTIHFLSPSTGKKVRFRMLVFRPFVGEILAGKVSCCNKQGIKVGCGIWGGGKAPCCRL